MRSWIANFTASWKNSSKSEIPQAALYSTILIRQPLCIEKIFFFCPLIYFFLEKMPITKVATIHFFPDNYMLLFLHAEKWYVHVKKLDTFFLLHILDSFFKIVFYHMDGPKVNRNYETYQCAKE